MIVNRQIIMKAKWIWNNEAFEIVSFTNNFYANNRQSVLLRVACDGIYVTYVNGELVIFS